MTNAATGFGSSAGLHIEPWQGNYYIDTYENADIVIDTQDTDRLTVKGNGTVVVWTNLSIGTDTPQATLDVAGFMRLAKNGSAPASCGAANDGAIALTSQYTLCVCKGGSSSWVRTTDGTSACSW